MNKKNQFALIATAWGHKGSLEHLSNMGEGLYNRYCLGDDYSKSAQDFKEMSELCEQLKDGLYSEKVATGMAATLNKIVTDTIESGGGFIFLDGKGDDYLNHKLLEEARRNGRCLDTHVIDFSNPPEQSSSINLETGEIR